MLRVGDPLANDFVSSTTLSAGGGFEQIAKNHKRIIGGTMQIGQYAAFLGAPGDLAAEGDL